MSTMWILWLSHIKIQASQIHCSLIIPKMHDSSQVCITFFKFMRCTLVFVLNEMDTKLQLLSSWWLEIAAGFQEVYFYHSITTYWVGVCHSVAWLQNTHSFVVLNSYKFHSFSVLITEMSILWFMVCIEIMSVAESVER